MHKKTVAIAESEKDKRERKIASRRPDDWVTGACIAAAGH